MTNENTQYPLEFIKWYSGMDEQKILNAYERFKKEHPLTAEDGECIADLVHWPCLCPKCKDQPTDAPVIDKLTKLMADTFRKKHGDEKALLIKGKYSYTGNEIADAIDNRTEFGIEMIDGIIQLSIDLLLRDKVNLPDQPTDAAGVDYGKIIDSVVEEYKSSVFDYDGFVNTETFDYLCEKMIQQAIRQSQQELREELEQQEHYVLVLQQNKENLQSELNQLKSQPRGVDVPSEDWINQRFPKSKDGDVSDEANEIEAARYGAITFRNEILSRNPTATKQPKQKVNWPTETAYWNVLKKYFDVLNGESDAFINGWNEAIKELKKLNPHLE